MILVRVMGGLGNQMFQYALGRHLSIKNATTLKLDTTLLDDNLNMPDEVVTHRSLDLDILNVNFVRATPEEISFFNGKQYHNVMGKTWNKVLWQFRKKNLIIEKQRNFQPAILSLKGNKCLVGSWQSEKYFKPIEKTIRSEFTIKEILNPQMKMMANEINSSHSLCVFVRRGDYVTSSIYSRSLGAMMPEYFHKGIEITLSRFPVERIYVFSDDYEYCRELFKNYSNTTFIDNTYAGIKYGVKLHLMSLCRYFVIPNSTYGWWAAWLSNRTGKQVIAPKKWFIDDSFSSEDKVPEDWQRI